MITSTSPTKMKRPGHLKVYSQGKKYTTARVGRNTRYKAGPRNGISAAGRSQEPLSYLQPGRGNKEKDTMSTLYAKDTDLGLLSLFQIEGKC